MTVLSDRTIRQLGIVEPFHERTKQRGMSFGLSCCGYDIRAELGQKYVVLAPGTCTLVVTVERFTMPVDVVGIVHDKSTWARQGLFVGNVVLEPGWRGYLSLTIANRSEHLLEIHRGDPIAQVVFHRIDHVPEHLYDGKYQDQGNAPQPAKFER